MPRIVIRLRVATRTRKNSSRLLEKIPRNLMRDLRGTLWSLASCKTRALKLSQLISRGIILCLLMTIVLENLVVRFNQARVSIAYTNAALNKLTIRVLMPILYDGKF